jgi:hypothetical protein
MLPGPTERDRPLPFDAALPHLRMNCAVAQFTNSKERAQAGLPPFGGQACATRSTANAKSQRDVCLPAGSYTRVVRGENLHGDDDGWHEEDDGYRDPHQGGGALLVFER